MLPRLMFGAAAATTAVLIIAANLAAAAAARRPNADELARIEGALRAAGFTRWEEIELDDKGWGVDDARDADGRKFDLVLSKDDFRVLSKREDD